MTLKSGITMLKIQLCMTGINYILKYIQIENNYLKIVITFYNITVLLYKGFDQINAAMVRPLFFFFFWVKIFL